MELWDLLFFLWKTTTPLTLVERDTTPYRIGSIMTLNFYRRPI